MTPPPEAVPDDAPHWAEFRCHLRLHRLAALRIFAAVLLLAMLVAALVPARYAATATLAVLPAPEFTVRQDAGSRAMASSGLAMDAVMKAETAILESDSLHEATLHAVGTARLYPELDPAAQRPAWRQVLHDVAAVLLAPWRVSPPDRAAALHEQALARFAGALDVLPAKDGNVITVTYHHHEGALAALAVNAMLARYAERRSRLYDDPQLAVVRRQTAAAAREAADAEAALAEFKADHIISDFGAERDLMLHRRDQVAADLAAALSTAGEQAARLQVLNQQIASLPPSVPLFRDADTDTRLQPVEAALVDLRGQLATARGHYTESSRKVADLQAQIAARQAERTRMAADPAASAIRTGRSLALDPLLVDRARAAADGAAAAARATALRAELTHLAAALARLDADETTLAGLNRRRAAAAASFASASQVQDEQRMTEAEDALRLANVRVIQAAQVPQRPAPTPLLIVIAGALLGALAAIAWLLAGFSLRPTFLTPEGLAAATGLPVLGVFPADHTASVL
jgi:uncharacterized protein involved in exopolysaccharide biosynthesis